MFSALRRIGRRLRLGSDESRDAATASDRRAGRTDPVVGTAGERGDKTGWVEAGGSAYEPANVKPYDEGRPKK
jgi:hypothetical protein